MRTITALLVAAGLLAAGCATHRMTDKQLHAQFLQYAGEPVHQFTYLGRYDSWQAVGPDTLVLWPTFNKAYLLTLGQPCTGLEYAQRIGLSSTNRTVTANIDTVRFEGHQRCFIQEIRPVDYARMQADRRAAREKAAHSGV